MKTNLKEKLENGRKRWKARSPKRNRILTNVCVGVVTVAGVIVAIPASIIVVPATLTTYAGIVVFAGGALGIKSKLTVENKEDLEK